MRKRCLIEVSPNDQLIVFCPPDMLKDKTVKRISFGSKAIDADFLPHPDKHDRIVISRAIQKAIQFPDFSIPLHIFFEEQSLFIGPLVGIFTSGFTAFPHGPAGDRSRFFAKLLSVQKTVGALPFLFGEQHIDWEQGTIAGYFYHDHQWKNVEVPFPNVIYDRLPNRKSEKNPAIKKIKNQLQKDYLIPWYNPGFFNKLDVYERLLQDEQVADFLPETHPFTSFSMIETMLSHYGQVYLKPQNGSLGFGVHQIIYDKALGDYYCRYQDRGGVNRLRKFSSLEKLFKSVFNGQNLKTMLVQQGILLLKADNRPVDFRIHTNKDDFGNWHVTAMAAKLAGKGSVTTHLRSGGEIRTVAEVLPEDQAGIYTEKLTDAALLLSKVLEENMEGVIGEIGFDMGIDRNGRVWLFEANSKPGRSIFKHPGLKDFDLLTRKLSLSFAVFLTEQSLLHPEELF